MVPYITTFMIGMVIVLGGIDCGVLFVPIIGGFFLSIWISCMAVGAGCIVKRPLRRPWPAAVRDGIFAPCNTAGPHRLSLRHRRRNDRSENVIVHSAATTGTDLTVVGNHGRSGLQKVLLCSFSQRAIELPRNRCWWSRHCDYPDANCMDSLCVEDAEKTENNRDFTGACASLRLFHLHSLEPF